MAGLTNVIASAIASELKTLSGVTDASPVPIDAIPVTPFIYLSPPKMTQVPGTWEFRLYRWVAHYLILRSDSEDRDATALNDAADGLLNALRVGVDLSAYGVSPAPIVEVVGADLDKFYTLNGTDYAAADFDIDVHVYQGTTYLP